MRQFCEFRVAEERPHLLFQADDGTRLGDGIGPSVRKVVLPTDDPRFREVERIDKLLEAQDSCFFTGWELSYRYTKRELVTAELFHLMVKAVFEPPGELCGTEFDESETCLECGAGRKQVSDLILDLRKAPKKKDIARTIAADEWIVSQRLAEMMVDAKLTGFDLGPVRHKARYIDDPVLIKATPTGKELYRMAKQQGLQEDSWEFDVWVHRDEHADLLDRVWEEHAELLAQKARRRFKPPPVWYQLLVTSNQIPMVPPTRTGVGPFDDNDDEYRCPYGHVAGFNLLSEVSVPRDEWDGSDVVMTSNRWGHRMGLLVPAPCLLISPRFYRLLRDSKIRGYKADVSYFV